MSEKLKGNVVPALQFNVAQLLKQPTGARREYDINAEIPTWDGELELVAPLTGHVQLTRAGSGILVIGQFQTVVELVCGRCLEPFEAPVQIEVEEEFVPMVSLVTGEAAALDPDQDSANLVDEHHILDLTEIVRQDLWINLPASPLCRLDCRGLCPLCGQNLNDGSCACQEEEIDARWSGLLEMVSKQTD